MDPGRAAVADDAAGLDQAIPAPTQTSRIRLHATEYVKTTMGKLPIQRSAEHAAKHQLPGSSSSIGMTVGLRARTAAPLCSSIPGLPGCRPQC